MDDQSDDKVMKQGKNFLIHYIYSSLVHHVMTLFRKALFNCNCSIKKLQCQWSYKKSCTVIYHHHHISCEQFPFSRIKYLLAVAPHKDGVNICLVINAEALKYC